MATGSKRVHRNHDYADLFPGKVFPTGELDVLECGKAILFIKSYDYGKQITDAQRRIWIQLAKVGDLDGSPGSITTYCVWNLGPHTNREVVIFDHMGESERKAMSLDEWRALLRAWWNDNKPKRR
jgi:hypothetical protein